MARMKTTPNPPPPINYKTLYHWAPEALLAETSQLNSHKDIDTYKQGESQDKFHVFGKELDVYLKVHPCRKGVPICADDWADPDEPFFFMYTTIFKRLRLCLPFSQFERALLTEVNVAPAQLHPNSWAFVRAFTILCDYFGHPPSVDIFLYFFEAKKPGKKLWLSFNGVARRVLLTLFQQSYKGFKKKFLKICCNIHDPTLLDDFPLYWVEKPGVKKPRSLEDLTPSDHEAGQLFSSLGVVFDTAKLIKLEFFVKALKSYIGTILISVSFLPLPLLVHCCQLHIFSSDPSFLVVSVQTWLLKKELADLLSKRRAVAAGVGTSTPATLPSPTAFAPNSSAPAPIDKQKGVVGETGSEDEDTDSGPCLQETEGGRSRGALSLCIW